MAFLIGILILTELFLIFVVTIINSAQIHRNGEILMSVTDQTTELQDATTELTAAVAEEKAQVAEAISSLNDRIADLEAVVNTQPDIDLSQEIAAVRAAADGVRAIYAPPAPDPITSDPVADDTEDDSEADEPAAPQGVIEV